MGRVTAPFGIKGWIKLYALSQPITNLLEYPVWWLGRDDEWREWPLVTARVQGNAVVAQLAGVDSREAAAALKGMTIAVPRTQLPPAAKNEFYWADLLGLRVVNKQAHDFGTVADIVQTGANDVLVVAGDEVKRDGGAGEQHETLIPFIASAIVEVDLAARVITVDWGEDY